MSLPGIGGSCNTCNKFLDTLQKNFLIQHVQTATQVRGSDTPHVLDLVITDTYDIIDDIDTLSPLGKSDHAILSIKCHSILHTCLLYTSPSPRDRTRSRMPSSA